ncbi:fibronectin type III domain-containing protein [Desulforhopalus sp. 52FAK]
MEIVIFINFRITEVCKKFYFKLFIFIPLIFCFAIPAVAQEYSFSWSANDGQVDGYKLYYKKGGSAGLPFDGSDAFEGDSPISITNGTSVTVSGLEENTTYHFALTAYSGADESDFTDIITVFPDDQQERIARVLTIINNYLLLDQE